MYDKTLKLTTTIKNIFNIFCKENDLNDIAINNSKHLFSSRISETAKKEYKGKFKSTVISAK